MAQVFLSYDREDGPRARVIAQALERAGHFVWFDLHIKGGAEYGREIERALEQSDAVVVLWSSRSVDSAWVRDEAAAGRDRGSLVPVLIEPVSPPMGFRQYQNLDFSGWKGRGKPPRLAELLDSIEAIAGPAAERTAPETPKPAPARTPRRPLPKWLLVGGAVMLVLLILGPIIGYFSNGRGERGVYTVAVAAAGSEANPLARDLLVNLGRLQSAKSGSLRLVSGLGDAEQRPDLIFESAGDHDPGRVGASLVLMDGKDRSVLWSKDFEQESGSLPDLKLQMGYTAARVLGCTLEGLGPAKGPSLDQQTLKLYLNVCADISELNSGDPGTYKPALVEIIRRAPKFIQAWQLLLIVEADAVEITVMEEQFDSAQINELREHIAKARQLQADLPEADLAELAMIPRNNIGRRMSLLDKAIQRYPRHVDVLTARSKELRNVGRMNESIEISRRAADLDPLSPFIRNEYISALAYAGRIESAGQELREAERLWPGTGTLRDIQFRFHLRYGDPRLALRMAPAELMEGNRLFLEARAEPTPANIQRLLDFALDGTYPLGAMPFLTQALGEFHKEKELYDIVIGQMSGRDIAVLGDIWFRPALRTFRQDPRFMIVAKRGGLVDYWQQSDKWPDFCTQEKLPYDCKAEAAKLARQG